MQPKMFENQSKKSHSPKKYKKDERLLPVVALKCRLEKLKGQKMGGCHFVKLTSVFSSLYDLGICKDL